MITVEHAEALWHELEDAPTGNGIDQWIIRSSEHAVEVTVMSRRHALGRMIGYTELEMLPPVYLTGFLRGMAAAIRRVG